ncbi:putative ribonuclease H-like domain-containing protein [Tanacetum coccineum]
MASMKYCDKHNQVGFLKKPEESAGFAEITATASTLADGTLELKATIDTIEYTITEASIRSKLQLADASGITMLPNNEIFEGMGHMGYPTDGSFTFWKSFFTPQWRFLVHHILHCMSSKSGGWDQFGSNIATALICLSTGRVYNFSKLIFDGMVANLKSKTKFLMYPRFLQMILDIQTENKHPYLAVTLTKKIFGNMKRGFRGVPRPLLPAMLSIVDPSAGQEAPSVTQPQPSSSVVPPTPPTTQPIPSEATTIPPLSQPAPPTPIAETTTASPSPSPSPAHEPMEHTFEQPSTDQQPPTPRQEATTSQLMTRIGDLEKQLKETKQTFGKAILTLVDRVKTLEVALKRKTKRVLLSDSEEEETEAQGRKTHDLDPLVSLVQELVTPSKTVNASGEEQVEDISPTTLEAAAILTKVQKIKSVDKGKRYKRRKSSKEFAGTGLDFEEVKSAFEKVNTGGIKVSSGIEEINAGSLDVNTGIDPVTTDSIRVSVPSPDRGRREGKAPMTEEEETQASRKTKEQILQEEAGLAEAIRLDALEKALEKEEVAKQVHLDSLIAQRMAEEQELTEEQKKRKAQVQFEAQSYTEEDWDTIRAKLEANAELKESVLGKDLTVEDYAKRMVELVNQRRKHFAEERARAKRNKPMTQTQLRNYMSNFLKNQGTWKLTQLKKLNFEEVKAEFEKLVKQLDTYVPMNFEATKESLKRFGEELQTKTAKKLKFDDEDHDRDESKDLDEANEKDDSTSGTKIPINPIPVAIKSPSIANYKIIKQGRKGVYQIVRESGTDMLYRIVMKKHGMNEPEDEFEKSTMSNRHKDWLVQEQTALELTSPEQMATVEMVFSRHWTCTFLVAKGLATPELMANQKEALLIDGLSVDLKSKISRVPSEVYVSTPITTNEKGVSAPKSKEVEPSCVSHIKTPRQPIKDQATPKVNRKNWNAMMERELGEGYSFTKKKCFVCGSLSHLIKDYDYYEKKMAREAEVKKQRVCNTGNMMSKSVWTNTNRINHANQFVPRPVQLNTGRPNINSIRTNINTSRTNINSVRSRVNIVTTTVNTVRSRQPVPTRTSNSFSPKRPQDHPLKNMVDRGIFDSGCSGHMTGNKDQLEDFEEFNGGSVTFGGSKGYISGKGKIRVGNLDFDSVSFVKELGHFNLFSISQICDKQHKVLFTETECLVVSSDFKMPDENQILLKVPRHHNMYSFDMKTPTPAKGFACLIAKATSDESKLWHRRLGHINFKNLNKLVKGNLVRGLPSKVFKNNHTCVACHKGKQHRASCKAKLERLITEPLHTLHMDLFGPTSVKSINHASYYLVITDDCTRFSWVFFLASKDETSGILQNFIRQIENQLTHRVKIIRSDNGTKFKNRDMLEFYGNKGIKQEYSNSRTPQQNGVAERKNMTLIEAARTMLADSRGDY